MGKIVILLHTTSVCVPAKSPHTRKFPLLIGLERSFAAIIAMWHPLGFVCVFHNWPNRLNDFASSIVNPCVGISAVPDVVSNPLAF